MSRIKIEPLQTISILCLELMAAAKELDTCEAVAEVVDVPHEEHFFWSDSLDVLHLLHHHFSTQNGLPWEMCKQPAGDPPNDLECTSRNGTVVMARVTTIGLHGAKLSLPDRLEPPRYSSWVGLWRVWAWMWRFLDNCRRPTGSCTSGPLEPDELEDVETMLQHKDQHEPRPGSQPFVEEPPDAQAHGECRN